jgi:hypothetical protein
MFYCVRFMLLMCLVEGRLVAAAAAHTCPASNGLQLVVCPNWTADHKAACLRTQCSIHENTRKSLRTFIDSNQKQQLFCKASTCPCNCSAVQLLLGQLADK